jgi:hypothetical protein
MISAALWVVLGLAVAVAGARLEIGSLARPGPGFLPVLSGVVLAGLGAVVVAREWRARAPAGAGARDLGPAWRVAATIGALVAYAALLAPLGFAGTTLAVLAFLLRGVAGLAWGTALGVAVGTTALSYLLFAVWLRVPFPVGPWGL